ncbi:uncharacterized protein A4U43_C04F12740 [Asparagus officinalis]|uniref:Uncharacterized protein n=1 Tax=Asparagus officinalis TaxID=4686 RepID=A0A5P1F573_ASPOF|nr:uncharacterized protein A4U43_C04F12740 [Asparagus officinalis]
MNVVLSGDLRFRLGAELRSGDHSTKMVSGGREVTASRREGGTSPFEEWVANLAGRSLVLLGFRWRGPYRGKLKYRYLESHSSALKAYVGVSEAVSLTVSPPTLTNHHELTTTPRSTYTASRNLAVRRAATRAVSHSSFQPSNFCFFKSKASLQDYPFSLTLPTSTSSKPSPSPPSFPKSSHHPGLRPSQISVRHPWSSDRGQIAATIHRALDPSQPSWIRPRRWLIPPKLPIRIVRVWNLRFPTRLPTRWQALVEPRNVLVARENLANRPVRWSQTLSPLPLMPHKADPGTKHGPSPSAVAALAAASASTGPRSASFSAPS